MVADKVAAVPNGGILVDAWLASAISPREVS